MIGSCWAVVEAPLVETVRVLSRLARDRRGPVLAHSEAQLAWWLVPTDVDDAVEDIPQLNVLTSRRDLLCPPVDRALESRFWLELPDGSGRLTDPAVLGAAFGPAAPLLSAQACS